MKKIFLALLFVLVPFFAQAATPNAPILLVPEVLSSTAIRWRFMNTSQESVAFELWDVLARAMVKRVDNRRATYIDETNIVPADPDMACGRYVVAVNAQGERSFGQVNTYPCVRTPPVPPPMPEIIFDPAVRSLRVRVSSGANDPATGIGIYDKLRGAWLSPEHLFVSEQFYPTVGQWGTFDGTLLIGFRPNSSFQFYTRARSVTGEVSDWVGPIRVRMPLESADIDAPILDRIGELAPLRSASLAQTFFTKSRTPAIAGLTRASIVTITLDDRPYSVPTTGDKALKHFSFVPQKLSPGLHYVRIGAHRNGVVAWTPTIEFYVK